MLRKVKRIYRNIKSKQIVDRIKWLEGALVDQGRDYYPFGLDDYCGHNPDLIKKELIRLRDCRKARIEELKRNDYRLCKKLYPNEAQREKELNQIIEESYNNAVKALKVFEKYAAKWSEESKR